MLAAQRRVYVRRRLLLRFLPRLGQVSVAAMVPYATPCSSRVGPRWTTRGREVGRTELSLAPIAATPERRKCEKEAVDVGTSQ